MPLGFILNLLSSDGAAFGSQTFEHAFQEDSGLV